MAKTDENIAQEIMSEGKLEADAKKAKLLMDEYANWMERAQAFIQETGNQPQEPSNFLRNVLLTYAMKRLENKIITL